MIAFNCPHCGADIRVRDDSAVGRRGTCQSCDEPIIVPTVDAVTLNPRRWNRRYVYLGSGAVLLLILAAVWWPRETAAPADICSMNLCDGVDEWLAHYCVHEIYKNTDHPESTDFQTARFAVVENIGQSDTGQPIQGVVCSADYRGLNRSGALQRFRVKAIFLDNPSNGSEPMLVKLDHTPPLPGIDFDQLYSAVSQLHPVHLSE